MVGCNRTAIQHFPTTTTFTSRRFRYSGSGFSCPVAPLGTPSSDRDSFCLQSPFHWATWQTTKFAVAVFYAASSSCIRGCSFRSELVFGAPFGNTVKLPLHECCRNATQPRSKATFPGKPIVQMAIARAICPCDAACPPPMKQSRIAAILRQAIAGQESRPFDEDWHLTHHLDQIPAHGRFTDGNAEAGLPAVALGSDLHGRRHRSARGRQRHSANRLRAFDAE